MLSKAIDDRARALAGRLWLVHKQNPFAAAESFWAIESDAIALQPQVVIERDKALAALGKAPLEDRGRWFRATSALEDDWLVERRANYLYDCDNFLEALELLKNTRFQLVHQRYERTCLLRRIDPALDLEPTTYAPRLGEDDLAKFGSYREYPEHP